MPNLTKIPVAGARVDTEANFESKKRELNAGELVVTSDTHKLVAMYDDNGNGVQVANLDDVQDATAAAIDELIESDGTSVTGITVGESVQQYDYEHLDHKLDKTAIAPLFDSSQSYAVGDCVIHDGQLYKCRTAGSGAWNAARWTLSSVVDVAASADALDEAVTELKGDLNKLSTRKYLFVGDSYAEGYSHDGNNLGWCKYLAGYLGLSDEEYERVYHGGYAFRNGLFASLIQNVQGDGFTDVVVCGGYGDNISTESEIINGIQTFKSAVSARWPDARIHVGFIAYNKEGNGTGAVENWEEKREELINKVLPTYQQCVTVGCHYLNNVEYWLTEEGLTPSDGYHPSASGNQNIAKGIANALTTGSAPIPSDYNLRNIESGLSEDIKTALLTCFEQVAWTDDEGFQRYRALKIALGMSGRRPELPDIYEQVEYIHGTGTQYINTGINSQIPFKAVMEASVEGLDGGILCAGVSSVANSRFYVFGVSNQPNRMWVNRFDSGAWKGDSSDIVELNRIYKMTSGIESIGNNQVKTYIEHDDIHSEATVSTPTLGYPIYIMRMESTNSNSLRTYLYSLKMYSGDTLLFDGIPCYRISDNKTGMYDVVRQTFFTNNGTGEFVIGNVVA